MKIRYLTKKFTLTDDVKAHVEKKLGKFDKFFSESTEASVTLSSEKIGERVEVTIFHGGSLFRSEESDRDYKCALDRCIDIIERQIRKNRTRLEKKIHVQKDFFTAAEHEEAEDEIKISKIKKFEIAPMTVEEAVLQMNLLSHQFFVFINAESGLMNVVYKRRENDYGVIEPIV